MEAKKCDDCGKFYLQHSRGTYYPTKSGVSAYYELKGNLDLCDDCWNKMVDEVTKRLKIEEHSVL